MQLCLNHFVCILINIVVLVWHTLYYIDERATAIHQLFTLEEFAVLVGTNVNLDALRLPGKTCVYVCVSTWHQQHRQSRTIGRDRP